MASRNPTTRPRKVAGQTSVIEPVGPVDADAPPPPPPPDDPATGDGGGSRRRTIALVAAIVVLIGVGVAEILYLTTDSTATVSSSRPVVTGDLAHQAAVETAARSTVEILSTSYDDYDNQVEDATSKMTDSFAQEYRETAAGIRDRFIEQKTKLQFEAVGQSVVQASPEQVQALLFLNQYVEKVVDGQPRTDYAQYRALVTVVHTDHGWLVSNIETK
jgi:Mce-associated membrane protein